MRRTVALAWSALLVAACSRGEPRAEGWFAQGPWVGTPQGYSLRGWTHRIPGPPDTLVFGTTIANRGDSMVWFASIGCEGEARAYPTPERTGSPAWDTHPGGQECVEGHGIPLAPGDSLPAGATVVSAPVPEILGDSLPEGRYFFAVSSPTEIAPPPPVSGRPSPEDAGLPKQPIYVPAGSMRLERQ